MAITALKDFYSYRALVHEQMAARTPDADDRRIHLETAAKFRELTLRSANNGSTIVT